MRTHLLALSACALLAFMGAAAAGPTKPAQMEHPGEVALSDEGGNWVYRQFPSGLRLYTYDKDTPGNSACGYTCEGGWPPILARADSKPTGDWTIIMREGNRRQWAYKGQPVYTRFHDTPSEPIGEGIDKAWHLLEP